MPHHMRRSWCAQGGDGACSRRAESLRGTCSARAQTRCTGRAMAQCAPCRAVGVVVSSNTILKMTTTIPRARMKVAEIAESRNPAARSRSAPRAAVASGVCRETGGSPRGLSALHTRQRQARPGWRAGWRGARACRGRSARGLAGLQAPVQGVRGSPLHARRAASQRHLVEPEQSSFCAMSMAHARPVESRSRAARKMCLRTKKSRKCQQTMCAPVPRGEVVRRSGVIVRALIICSAWRC